MPDINISNVVQFGIFSDVKCGLVHWSSVSRKSNFVAMANFIAKQCGMNFKINSGYLRKYVYLDTKKSYSKLKFRLEEKMTPTAIMSTLTYFSAILKNFIVFIIVGNFFS